MEKVTLVRSKITGKSWLKNAQGKRVTPKFKKVHVNEYGGFRLLYTECGNFLFHVSQKELLMATYKRLCFRKVTDKLYVLNYYYDIDVKKKAMLFNENGDLISDVFSEVGHLRHGLISVTSEGKVGFIDEQGNLKINPTWFAASDFNEYGYSIVRFEDGDKVSVIDKTGNLVTKPFDYETIKFINRDYLLATSYFMSGVIKLDGTIVIPLKYHSIDVRGDYIIVKYQENYGLYNLQGDMLLDCIYPKIIETPDSFVVEDFAKKEVRKQKIVIKGLFES